MRHIFGGITIRLDHRGRATWLVALVFSFTLMGIGWYVSRSCVESKGLFIQAAFYGIDGICHGGPCDPSPGQGLYRVESQLEGQNLTVYPQKIISGGFDQESSWVTNLKYFFTRRLPFAPSPSQRP